MRKRTLIVGLAVAALVGGAVAAWGYAGMRWGCPSYAEANRPRTVAEVTNVFGDNDLPLVPAPRESEARASVFRYATSGATVRVVVCATNACAQDMAARGHDRRRFRRGLNLLNVRIWLTASDRRTADTLLSRLNAAASALSRSTRDKRCFPD